MAGIPDVHIDDPDYLPAGKLQAKVALITGGDSGIGAATAVAYAKEGAHVVINYLSADDDAEKVAELTAKYGTKAICLKGNITDPKVCQSIVKQTVETCGALDILVLNAGTQEVRENVTDITPEQVDKTFKTNIYSMFYLVQAARPHMQAGSSIITTTSVTAYRGSQHLIDYSATKGAITTFTRSLSTNLAGDNIRVNGVAPGPVWTPLVLTSFDDEKLEKFGKDQPLGRAAQPTEIAPAYVFLASRDARYITGQILHVNGGEIVNG